MKQKNPPKWALRFLAFYCKDGYREQIEGDLFELFEREPSRWKFAWNTIRFFRLRYLKGLNDYQQLTTLAMVRNYLKVAFRTLIRQKTYTLVNILGLAIGLASCLLITIYVNHERSYDDFYPESESIYRVLNGRHGGWTPPLLAKTLVEDVSEITAATRLSGIWEALLEIGDRSFTQKGALYADPSLFKVFQTEFLQGDSETALAEPNSIVLTESLAKKCFPDASAYGQTMRVDEEQLKVTGIVIDPPKNTHLPYEYVISKVEPDHRNWTGNSVFTYAKTISNVDTLFVNEKLLDFYELHVGPEALQWSGHKSFADLVAQFPDRLFGFKLFPVTDIHLKKPYLSRGKGGNEKNVVIFSIIALFILIIACVNYINMTTARSGVRSKEVGIRKALGSVRQNIVTQFIVESLIITFMAIIIALLLASASIPYFNVLTGRVFEVTDVYAPQNLIYILGLLLISGILAGSYPAYIMSQFSPLKALRNQKQQGGKAGLRNILVSFQFAVSVCLLAATFIVFKQLNHMQSQELGLNTDQTLIITGGDVLGDKYDVFKHELEGLPGVEVVGKASNVPFHGYGDWGYRVPNEEGSFSPNNAFTSAEVKDVLDLEVVQGRFFNQNQPSDTNSVVINESFAKELGWQDPVGKQLTRMDQLDFTIVGVLKDFNFKSLKHKIAPMIFRYGGIASSETGIYHQYYVLAKISSKDILGTLSSVEEVWNSHARSYPLDASFMDDSFQRHYETERKFGSVFTTFAGLAVFIAMMGLFALTTFVLQKRFKEIAIRKVLGANIRSIIKMILKDFTLLVAIGSALGIGVAYYWLEEWLKDYSYRIDIYWYLLALPVCIVLIFTWIVVTTKAFGVATSNPTNALKDE